METITHYIRAHNRFPYFILLRIQLEPNVFVKYNNNTLMRLIFFALFLLQGKCFACINPEVFVPGFQHRMQTLMDFARTSEPVITFS